MARVCKMIGQSEQAMPLLDEARQRFEVSANTAAERMASVCVAEKGECFWYLGRYDEAVAAYEESIRRAEKLGDDRGVAVNKSQIGSIRGDQRRFSEALTAFAEAREQFTRLDEPGSVAVLWHQTGVVHRRAGEPEAAEDAYRKSLAIKVRLGNIAGQANTLGELGSLYLTLGRTEEAVSFFRQAADKYSEIRDVLSEAKTRSGLAIAFRNLGRLDEAREEIQHSIKGAESSSHAIQPWKFWDILFDIEINAGNPNAAFDAKRKAITCYLAYRRDGGENHDDEGRLSLGLTEYLLTGNNAAAASLLQEVATDPNLATTARTFIRALQAIVGGSRDRTLADAQDLNYRMAAEILFLIETLENHGAV